MPGTNFSLTISESKRLTNAANSLSIQAERSLLPTRHNIGRSSSTETEQNNDTLHLTWWLFQITPNPVTFVLCCGSRLPFFSFSRSFTYPRFAALFFSLVNIFRPTLYIQHPPSTFRARLYPILTSTQQVSHQGEARTQSPVLDNLLLSSSNGPRDRRLVWPTLYQPHRNDFPVARQLLVQITDILHRQLWFHDTLRTQTARLETVQ